MSLWFKVFFGAIFGMAAFVVIIVINVWVHQSFGDTASFIAVVITIAAALASVVTGLKKLTDEKRW